LDQIPTIDFYFSLALPATKYLITFFHFMHNAQVIL